MTETKRGQHGDPQLRGNYHHRKVSKVQTKHDWVMIDMVSVSYFVDLFIFHCCRVSTEQGLFPLPNTTHSEFIRCAKLPNNNVSIFNEATNISFFNHTKLMLKILFSSPFHPLHSNRPCQPTVRRSRRILCGPRAATTLQWCSTWWTRQTTRKSPTSSCSAAGPESSSNCQKSAQLAES